MELEAPTAASGPVRLFETEVAMPLHLQHRNLLTPRHGFKSTLAPWVAQAGLDPLLIARVPAEPHVVLVDMTRQSLRQFADMAAESGVPVSERTWIALLLQAAKAVACIESQHVTHRAVCADAFLMDERGRVLLGSCGWALETAMPDEQGTWLPVRVGSVSQIGGAHPQCTAPQVSKAAANPAQVLAAHTTLDKIYAGADAWSLGRMTYALLCGPDEDPFGDTRQRRGSAVPLLPSESASLVRGRPACRLNFARSQIVTRFCCAWWPARSCTTTWRRACLPRMLRCCCRWSSSVRAQKASKARPWARKSASCGCRGCVSR